MTVLVYVGYDMDERGDALCACVLGILEGQVECVLAMYIALL
jgi:hypothetical protein